MGRTPFKAKVFPDYKRLCKKSRYRKKHKPAHFKAFLCHPSFRKWGRFKILTDAFRTFRYLHNPDLYTYNRRATQKTLRKIPPQGLNQREFKISLTFLLSGWLGNFSRNFLKNSFAFSWLSRS